MKIQKKRDSVFSGKKRRSTWSQKTSWNKLRKNLSKNNETLWTERLRIRETVGPLRGTGCNSLRIVCWSQKFWNEFDLPFFIALLQNLVVAALSFILVIIFEEINFSKIKLETVEILYAGVLSGGAAFALQLFGQKNISAAPAAIVMSLEGVFAAVSAWIILNQILGLNNIMGCTLILGGVLLSQLAPIYEKNKL